jgi:hypothetical protein
MIKLIPDEYFPVREDILGSLERNTLLLGKHLYLPPSPQWQRKGK